MRSTLTQALVLRVAATAALIAALLSAAAAQSGDQCKLEAEDDINVPGNITLGGRVLQLSPFAVTPYVIESNGDSVYAVYDEHVVAKFTEDEQFFFGTAGVRSVTSRTFQSVTTLFLDESRTPTRLVVIDSAVMRFIEAPTNDTVYTIETASGMTPLDPALPLPDTLSDFPPQIGNHLRIASGTLSGTYVFGDLDHYCVRTFDLNSRTLTTILGSCDSNTLTANRVMWSRSAGYVDSSLTSVGTTVTIGHPVAVQIDGQQIIVTTNDPPAVLTLERNAASLWRIIHGWRLADIVATMAVAHGQLYLISENYPCQLKNTSLPLPSWSSIPLDVFTPVNTTTWGVCQQQQRVVLQPKSEVDESYAAFELMTPRLQKFEYCWNPAVASTTTLLVAVADSSTLSTTTIAVIVVVVGAVLLALLIAGAVVYARSRGESAQQEAQHEPFGQNQFALSSSAVVEMRGQPATRRPSMQPVELSETEISALRMTTEFQVVPVPSDDTPLKKPAEGSIRMLQTSTGSDSSPTSADARRNRKRAEMVKNGQYTKGKLLGRGATGAVYAALLKDGSTVAVKEMALLGGANDVDRQVAEVEHEVELLTTLAHPHIVCYYGATCDREAMQISVFMENVTGGSLGELVRGMSQPIAEGTARMFTWQLVHALAYVHAHGVVHRDLKCDNVLRNDDGNIKLADFGTAKALGTSSATRIAQTMVGTPLYMAPEVLMCQDVNDTTGGYGVKADVWSLGITVAELCSQGEMPWPQFAGAGHAFMYISSPEGMPVIPPHLSHQCADFVMTCCRRNPRERPAVIELLQHPWLKDLSELSVSTRTAGSDGV